MAKQAKKVVKVKPKEVRVKLPASAVTHINKLQLELNTYVSGVVAGMGVENCQLDMRTMEIVFEQEVKDEDQPTK